MRPRAAGARRRASPGSGSESTSRSPAFSPGFSAHRRPLGRPRIFISHGRSDEILPIDACSRRIVPMLEDAGYAVTYKEFDGPHTVPETVAQDAFKWFTR